MKRELTTLAAMLGLTLAASASPVGVYFNDDFTGTSLNTTIWTDYTDYTSPGHDAYVAMGKKTDKYSAISDVAGWVTGHGWNYNAKVIANYAVSPTTGETVILSSTDLQFSGWAQYNWWGLTSGDSKTDGIFLRQNSGNIVQAEIHKNGATQYLTLSHPTDLLTLGWNISWTPTRVKITSDIWGTIFDSAVQTLDNDGKPWNLPTANLAPTFESFYGNMSFDTMKLEVVPEPAVASLLLLGGAAFGLRRRRQ